MCEVFLFLPRCEVLRWTALQLDVKCLMGDGEHCCLLRGVSLSFFLRFTLAVIDRRCVYFLGCINSCSRIVSQIHSGSTLVMSQWLIKSIATLSLRTNNLPMFHLISTNGAD